MLQKYSSPGSTAFQSAHFWHSGPNRSRLNRRVLCQKGFGSSQAKQKAKKRTPFREGDSDWISVGNLSSFQGAEVKAIQLKDKSFVVLYNSQGAVYCSDANSTAYKFPLANAKIIEREGSPAVEVPLDGTVYDLETGKVLEWCPRNNPFRTLLGMLKSATTPQNLKVYPTHLDDSSGQIYVKFSS